MRFLIWSLPPIAHEIILRLTGWRLVLIREDIPELAHIEPKFFLRQRQRLVWTKDWPMRKNGIRH